jgi:glycerate 2-kinase
VVADVVGLDDVLEHADLVITGEGFLDEQSFDGKVVGGVVERAGTMGVPVLVIAGEVYDDAADRVEAVSLVEQFGETRAKGDPLECVEAVVSARLCSSTPS